VLLLLPSLPAVLLPLPLLLLLLLLLGLLAPATPNKSCNLRHMSMTMNSHCDHEQRHTYA
jgi:hypothetical protein